jgi:threonine aldolase
MDGSSTPADLRSVAEAAKAQGVLVGQVGGSRLRLVTHLEVDRTDVDRAVEVLGPLLAR